MKIVNNFLSLKTKGSGDLLNITENVSEIVLSSKIYKGSALIFVIGSTAAITTIEYEPGLIEDIGRLYERLVPSNKSYKHDETWGDANGFSHLRASLQGPSLPIPIDKGRPVLGTWQQIVLAEFDNRPRNRKIVVQLTGE
jgi:secondary thiamine-phosphate synthase enzyme